MFGDVLIGTVCAFAGQIHPVSFEANNLWASLPCASDGSQGAAVDPKVPLTYPESAGWMLCDGRYLSIAAYPELYAVLGDLYGKKSDAFRIPDYRGLFLRGVDAGSGLDPDAAKRVGPLGTGTSAGIGSLQCDALQEHTHTYRSVALATPANAGNAAAKSTADEKTSLPDSPARVSKETRPKNIAVNYLIKYR